MLRISQYHTIENWARAVVKETKELLYRHPSEERDYLESMGDHWGIVLTHGDYADLLSESNWDCINSDMHKKYPRQYDRAGYHMYLKLWRKDGKLTQAAMAMYDILYGLEDYAIYNEDDFSMRESEQDYEGNLESIRMACNDLYLIDSTSDNLTGLVYEWLYENDQQAIERASTGYSDKGGYIDDIPIYCALFCMGYIDTEFYDSEELDDLTNKIEGYIWADIKQAFSSYKTKLEYSPR